MSIVDTFLDALTQRGCKPIRYSDADQFEKLWSDAWHEFTAGEEPSRMVIVWDGAPAGHRLLPPHLTPLDWALAASLGLLNSEEARGRTDWSLHIVDLSLGAYRHTDTWSVLHAASLLDAMPWVRLYGPLQLKRRGYDPRRLGPVIRGELGDVATMADCLRGRRKIMQDELRRLTQSWQGSIQRSDDHHDLNNLVAPALLSTEYAEGSDDAALRAFARKCHWIGAIPADRPDYGLMAEAVKAALAALPERGTVRVTMVDDMAQRGWGALVQEWLGAPQAVPFETHTSPRPLEEVLNCLGAEDFRRRDYSRSVWQAQAAEPVDEVIIWDLRLFGNGDATSLETRRGQERGFYCQLVQAIRRCGLIDSSDLAWPGFTSEEIDEVEKWCDAMGPDEPSEAALTLAPRCMALLSPTTPIMLLSTTSRRSVVEAFKPYGNILTGVEKLRPLDHLKRDLDRVGQQWREAWDAATSIIATRKQLRQIELAARWLSESIPVAGPRRNRTDGSGAYVEVYIDETGAEGATVGGVVAIYPNAGGGKASADDLDDLLFANGVCYYDPLVSRTDVPIQIKPKGTSCARELRQSVAEFNADGERVQLYQFALQYEPSQHENEDAIRRAGDFKYFQTAATALEVLLYSAIPAAVRRDEYTVSIYVGTRHLGGVHGSRLSDERKKLIRDFGYDKLIGENFLESVSGNSVLPVVARIMSERRAADRFSVDRALGVTLKYEKERGHKVKLANRFVCRREGCKEVELARVTPLERRFKAELGIDANAQLPAVEWTGGRRFAAGEYADTCSHPDGHRWIPDYRALHYVADEVLRRPSEYSQDVLKALPGFGDVDDVQLRALVLASRLLDQDEPVLATIRAVTTLSGTKQKGLDSLTPIRRLLLAELFEATSTLRGNDLTRVAAAQRIGQAVVPKSVPGVVSRESEAHKHQQGARPAKNEVGGPTAGSDVALLPAKPAGVSAPAKAQGAEAPDCSVTIRKDKLPAGIEPVKYAQETLKLCNAHCEASQKKPGNVVIRFRALQQDPAARDAIKAEQDAKRVVGLAGQTESWLRWQG
jgi:hypothetical protein